VKRFYMSSTTWLFIFSYLQPAGDVFSSGFNSIVCQPEVKFHRFALNRPLPSSLEGQDIIITNDFGSTIVPYLKKRLTHPEGYKNILFSKNFQTY